MKKFHFNFISDIHTDHHIRVTKYVPQFVDSIMPEVNTGILIVAGDIANHNEFSIAIMQEFKNRFDEVLFTLGNHDFYVEPRQKTFSLIRAFKFTGEAQRIGCKWLDGTIFEIDGVKIGGTHMWFDGSYTKKIYGLTDEEILNLYNAVMSDATLVTFNPFNGPIQTEFKKLEKIHKDVDIMVTHIPPLIHYPYNIPEKFRNEVTGFFSFDGHKYFTPNIKCWIFGHTHDSHEFYMNETWCICNPLGYPHENNNTKIMDTFIEIPE